MRQVSTVKHMLSTVWFLAGCLYHICLMFLPSDVFVYMVS